MTKTMNRIIEEIVRDIDGQVIATREFTNEVTQKGNDLECITREVIKLDSGKVVVNRVLHKSIFKNNKHKSVNLVTGQVS